MKIPSFLRIRLMLLFISGSFWLNAGGTVFAQDQNVLFPPGEIEQRLKYRSFEIYKIWGSRWEDDLTKRILLTWPDSVFMQVKLKRAPHDGAGDNNEPRYQIAAYELQKLFLDPEDYVVPPTVGFTFPQPQYEQIEKGVEPTFKNAASVYVLLAYWLNNVSPDNIYDKDRFNQDPVYAKHLANMNILAYLIDHKDSNQGNFLISTDPANPRVFAVDNDLAFNSPESNRGTFWRQMQVDRVPAATVEKLKTLDRSMLDETLGVVEQYEIRDGYLFRAEPTANLDSGNGVRQSNDIVQLGLTDAEIGKVFERLVNLLKLIDSGKIETF